LGSKNAQELLERTYDVDSVIIPPFRVKRYRELSAVIVKKEEEWYDEIVESNLIHLQNQRAVLIITKFISEAEELNKRFTEKFKELKIKEKKIRLYKTGQDQETAVKDQVNSGDLIIATNIAGRGTDIKTSDNVEAHGGLHVCVTSLPSNERVEQQNVGRTSRTGHLGTSQFIIHHKYHSSIEFLKKYRDNLENQDLMRAEQEMKKTLIKDKIFESFCELLKIVPQNTTKKAVEDRFGIWLQVHSETSDDLKGDYEIFDNKVREDLMVNEVIQNPSYYVQIGNQYLEAKDYDIAIANYTKAIELDGEFSEIAHYNRGYARLMKNCNDIHGNKEEVKNAVEDFKMVRSKTKNREMELHVIQTAKESDGNALSQQVTHKLTLYGMQKNTIEQAIGPDEEDYKARLDEMEEQKKKLDDTVTEHADAESKIKSYQKNFKKVTKSYDSELKKLADEKKKIIENKKDTKEIDQKIESFQKQEKYLDYKKLRENLELFNSAKTEIESLKSQIERHKDYEKGIILWALEQNRDIKIELKDIPKSLPDDQNVELYEDEIREFSANGFLGAVEISELPPIDW
jgi:tetratricopeptide (TPR) repeat protein